MKRRFIAAAWIAAASLPLALATLFVLGCCVLPLHQVVHKVMPVCHMAADVMRGGTDDAPDSSPARGKQQAAKRFTTTVPTVFRLAATTATERLLAPSSAIGYRSFITLGATRCDRDIGLHALLDTFLI